MGPSLKGKVCLVTGAARGIGKGIALQLGEAGATVYITGRTEKNLKECAAEIKARGGNPVIVQMDHGNDADVENLFAKIKAEQSGKLDVLVNNAYAGVDMIFKNTGKKFYETDPAQTWDCINGVGLRGHYICTTLASRIMVERQEGLIVNVSSIGGLRYLFNVAYGIGKAGCDRMAADCAMELKKKNVTMVSLWPGPVQTEYITENVMEDKDSKNPMKKAFEEGESIEFSGKAIANLAADPDVIKKTGRILQTVDLAHEYGFKDTDNGMPMDFRLVKNLLRHAGYTGLAAWVPEFFKVPLLFVHYGSYKF
ncbi:dehydrogenase/reductase SDR family member 1 isoform X2 [Eurytemora carolleeae]|uniref:dehydrogenase/reductase SDR family member 1 isoform X1 n=1 Tax=Eurytemora carolleeae TaxID=1294199 RepID=UPI000C75A9B1|nr:dehydrogenase/reductase SDR family member 1 isoform X1 [Eurytemora carolleeae]XP_023347001.1 dehydrogenase/reductase SDR family member 1 isoform X2 [Eurytemora carolleeae]|eukprot:XP_023347000.1 dehydrogenase/reductase SDR family member 1-like isoform X1 [Eurytemora affinis]